MFSFLMEYGIDACFILGLMVLGYWLEGINGKNGIIDEFLAPFPLGVAALAVIFIERLMA